VHGTIVPPRGGIQEFQIKTALAIGVETIIAVVSALDDVKRDTRQV